MSTKQRLHPLQTTVTTSSKGLQAALISFPGDVAGMAPRKRSPVALSYPCRSWVAAIAASPDRREMRQQGRPPADKAGHGSWQLGPAAATTRYLHQQTAISRFRPGCREQAQLAGLGSAATDRRQTPRSGPPARWARPGNRGEASPHRAAITASIPAPGRVQSGCSKTRQRSGRLRGVGRPSSRGRQAAGAATKSPWPRR
jgi:hypothetical protein